MHDANSSSVQFQTSGELKLSTGASQKEVILF